MVQVENQILRWVELADIPKGTLPLAGSSVNFDRMFIKKHMPRFYEYIGHRTIDVSSVAQLAKIWDEDIYTNRPVKKKLHRARPDIIESIEELKYYKENLFKIKKEGDN
jgi:oligoribonuclease